jgi:IS30 family transposase
MLSGERLSAMTVSKLLAEVGVAISHETIYQGIYAHRFGPPRQLLCRPRTRRKRRTRTGIDRRPLGDIRLVGLRRADLGSEAGHWEGDLLCGHDSRSAVLVLTERASRICLLSTLSNQTADHVKEAVIRLLGPVPSAMRKTLCWDQGRELARWPQLEAALDLTVYFCQPRSPWQKPLVENLCGLLRRWLPKNANLALYDQTHLDRISQLLNRTPRRSLGWDTAHNRYHRHVATTG